MMRGMILALLRARARGQAESDCAAEAQASKADPPGHPHPLFQRAYISFIGIAELPGGIGCRRGLVAGPGAHRVMVHRLTVMPLHLGLVAHRVHRRRVCSVAAVGQDRVAATLFAAGGTVWSAWRSQPESASASNRLPPTSGRAFSHGRS
jgi:hypothetical protein